MKYPKNYIRRSEEEFNKNVDKYIPNENRTAELLSIILNDNNFVLNKTKFYDIEFINRKLFIEVKTDNRVKDTGNFFIEFKYKNNDSGVNVSTAQFFCLNTENLYYLIPTYILRKLIINKPTRFIGKLFKEGYLVHKNEIIENSFELNEFLEFINNDSVFSNLIKKFLK
jgi:hypothetical protein